jgi:adenosylmethionine-8-amino-7-oxononanoate aminotransferase
MSNIIDTRSDPGLALGYRTSHVRGGEGRMSTDKSFQSFFDSLSSATLSLLGHGDHGTHRVLVEDMRTVT